jgi:nitrite reductase/ring-hydroxylating ferredoxin subunit
MKNKLNIIDRLNNLIINKETDYAKNIYKNPVNEYTSPQRNLKEKEILFKDTPTCIGIASAIPNKGDWFTIQLVDTPILVVRKNTTDIVAFLNICTHRGAKIAKDKGNKAYSFKCPYHSWVYDLEGNLIGRPREKAFDEIPKKECNLKQLKIHNHNGFLFITINSKSETKYKKNKPNLDKLIGNYNLNNYHYYKSKKISINMNWKLAVDTFLEIYHIDSLHDKTLSSIIMSDLALFDSFGQNIRLIGARTSVLGSKKRLLTNKEFITNTLQLYILFPNTILVVHSEHIEFWHVLPGQKENKCEVSLSLFSREKASTVSAKKHWENNFKLAIDVVEEEDFPLGEDVQKGFYADTKRKLIFGKNEPGLQHFHKKINEALKNG